MRGFRGVVGLLLSWERWDRLLRVLEGYLMLKREGREWTRKVVVVVGELEADLVFEEERERRRRGGGVLGDQGEVREGSRRRTDGVGVVVAVVVDFDHSQKEEGEEDFPTKHECHDLPPR